MGAVRGAEGVVDVEVGERRVPLRELGVGVATGVFGARMAVELVNEGPVTIVLE
jgi:D-tyrosyl-tRNA(Tyr) deacylase